MGSRPRSGEAGTPGSPGAPGAPSSPSLRGSPRSGPRAGGDGDPQPLGRPKSHPTWQLLTTADCAVAPAEGCSLAGPGSLRHGGFPVPRRAGGGREGHVVPPSSQDEALASYSVSVEALRSILKFKTIIGNLDVSTNVPRHPGLTRGEHQGSAHRLF